MMHSPLLRILGAILVGTAVLVFVLRSTFGTPTVTIHSTLPPAQQKAP